MKVKIAADFRDLFRPLTEAELEQAKVNNLADPNHERIPPIAIWNGTVIDGHHTLKIRENLRINGKPAKIRYCEMDFPDRDAALAYAIQAQLGRRNLDASQLAIMLARLPKNTHGGDRKSDQAENLPPDRESLANEHGISDKTLRSADKVVEHGAKAVQSAVATGEVTVSDAASIADLPKSEQVAALKKVTSGKARTLKSASAKGKPGGGKPTPPSSKHTPASPGPASGEAAGSEHDPLDDEPEKELTFEERVKEANSTIESFCRGLVKFFEENCPKLESVDHLGRYDSALASLKAACGTMRTCKYHAEPCPKCKGDGCSRCEKESDFGAVTVLTYQQLAG